MNSAILNHASLPTLPSFLSRPDRVVEIGNTYRMGDYGHRSGRDEWTGLRARVVGVCASGDVELETQGHGEVSIYHERLTTLGNVDGLK